MQTVDTMAPIDALPPELLDPICQNAFDSKTCHLLPLVSRRWLEFGRRALYEAPILMTDKAGDSWLDSEIKEKCLLRLMRLLHVRPTRRVMALCHEKRLATLESSDGVFHLPAEYELKGQHFGRSQEG